MIGSYDLMKALVVLAIEKTLLDIGKLVYDKVIDRLGKKYNCYIPDCFEKPGISKGSFKRTIRRVIR